MNYGKNLSRERYALLVAEIKLKDELKAELDQLTFVAIADRHNLSYQNVHKISQHDASLVQGRANPQPSRLVKLVEAVLKIVKKMEDKQGTGHPDVYRHLTADQKDQIKKELTHRMELLSEYKTLTLDAIAERYNVSYTAIQRVWKQSPELQELADELGLTNEDLSRLSTGMEQAKKYKY